MQNSDEIEAFTAAVNAGQLEDYYKNTMSVAFAPIDRPMPLMLQNDNKEMELHLNSLNEKQQETNSLLKRFKFFDGIGIQDIWGNKESFLN
jgi:hypothetical protein